MQLMRDISFFVNNFYNKIKINKKFLAFIVTGNKPILTEVLLSHLINKQLEDKFNQNLKISILEKIQKNNQKNLYFKLNKKKSNNSFLFYDLCLFISKGKNNLYAFKNKSLNMKEEILEKYLEDMVCLELEEELRKEVIKDNKFQKIPNTDLVLRLINNFGFDWLYNDSFFKKLDYFNTLGSYNQARQELSAINKDFKIILSDYFHNFSSARSNEYSTMKNKNIKFYGNSESFLNFFDENDDSSHLVKLNIGELKFNDAMHRLDRLCFDKKLISNADFSDFAFSIQSGALLL